MKDVKRIISIFISISLLLSSIIITANAKSKTINSADFSEKLCTMIEKYDVPDTEAGASNATNYTNRIIVKTNSNKSIEDCGAIASVEGFNNWHIFQYETLTEAGEALAYYREQDFVEYAEADRIITLNIQMSSTEYDVEPSLDDWGPILVESKQVIERYSDNENLPIINVAVLDTGLDEDHPYFDYKNRIVDRNFNTVKMSSGSSEDDNGHGTHVAGIIYNNTTENVKINPYKVLDKNGKGDAVGLYSAITVAADNGADVINMSLSFEEANSSLYKMFSDAVDYAYNRGATVVVAAGNDRKDVSGAVLASLNNVITVASIDENMAPSNFSNFGSAVDVAAPGRNINSAVPYDNNIDPIEHEYDNHYYAPLSGTSMATPFVSAAAAMLKTINTSYTPSNIESIIKDSSYRPDSWNDAYGTGIVNFKNMSSYIKTAAPRIIIGEYGAIITAESQAKIYYTTDGSDPVVGESKLYSGRPIDTTNIEKIKAIAIIEGQYQSDISVRALKWTKNVTIRYRGKKNLDISPSYIIKSYYSSNPGIVTVDSEGNITGVSAGEAQVTVKMNYNQVATYNVTVEYESWQRFIIYFLFGFWWYI